MLLFSERWQKELELQSRKATECSELSGLFRGSLEDKDVESYADKDDLACETSEGSKDSIRAIYVIF